MAWILVDIQLKVLIVVHEAPPDFVDCKMLGVLEHNLHQIVSKNKTQIYLLVQEVRVVPVSQGSFDLNHLATILLADGVDVRELSHSSTLSQSALHSSACSLKVMMSNL